MRLANFPAVISLLVVLVGCQSATAPVHNYPGAVAARPAVASAAIPVHGDAPRQRADATPDDLWQRMREGLSWQRIDNARVAEARRHYLAQPEYFDEIAGRANFYLYHIVDEVERRDLPMEIALLPLVESTLDPFASSPSDAAGLWQIMPATARHLGLYRSWWFDGRRNLLDSTESALDYVETLHEEFDGDWELALAAYNCGGGKLQRAQQANAKRGLSTDYWSLQLPPQTSSYVPKLVALAQLIAEPEAYGLAIPSVPNEPAFEVAETGGQLPLEQAAELAGVEPEILRALNPGQLRSVTAPRRADELLVPAGTRERFEEAVAGLDPEERNLQRPHRIAEYRVRRGDSLYEIARRHRVTVDDIVAWNSLKPDDLLHPGQKLTLYAGDG